MTIDYDPVGTAASVAGSWTVNGAAPTTESCAALGISHVRVRFVDGITTRDHADLVFPCTDGSFDTRPNRVVADGTWDMQLVAIDADGATIGEAPIETHDTIIDNGHIVMAAQDFTGSGITAISGSWTIDGATPTLASCGDLGINEVHVQFLDAAGAPDPTTTLKHGCADGSFVEEIAAGPYTIRVVAVDDGSNVLVMGMSETFTLAEGTTHQINGGSPVDFVGDGFNPLGTDSDLTATWSVGGNAASAAVCDAVAGATVDILFYAADDTTQSEPYVVHMGAPCAGGAFDSAAPLLAAGAYQIAVELHAADASVVSRVEADGATAVVAGTALDLAIDFRLASSTIVAYFGWEEDSDSGVYTDCASASSSAIDMHWELYYDDGSTLGEFVAGQDIDMNVACEDRIDVMGGVAGAALAAGDYDIVLTGYVGSTKLWEPMTACTVSIDADGGLGVTTCNADYVP